MIILWNDRANIRSTTVFFIYSHAQAPNTTGNRYDLCSHGSCSDADKARKLSGKLRAGLVGAGVLLATSLLLSITDKLGYTGQRDDASERPLFVILAAIVAVATDLLSARLEKKAEEDPD